jgi:hypothetical protein
LPGLRCGHDAAQFERTKGSAMKLLLEVVLSIVLHPIAMILMWIHLLGRSDMSGFKKFVWFVVSLIWGLGPIVYILVADGQLW